MPELDTGLIDIYVLYGSEIPNYFNRRILYYASLSDYLTAAGENVESFSDINFNPADGVSTFLDLLSEAGDKYTYLLAVNPTDNSIISRWFILEADRNMGGQYRLKLRRDVVAESISNTDFISQAPIYVEKGKLDDSDPMIVNKEGLTFNQIKKSELILSDPSESGYIVGYFESGASINSISITTGTENIPEYETASSLASKTGIDLSKINDLLSGIMIPFAVSDLFIHYGIAIVASNGLSSLRGMKIALNNAALNEARVVENSVAFSYSERIGSLNASSIPQDSGIANYINTQTKASVLSALNDVIDNDIPGEKLYTQEEYNKLKSFEGKKIMVGGVLYEMRFNTPDGTQNHPEVQIAQHENAFFDAAVLASVTTEKPGWIMYLNYQYVNVGLIKIEAELPSGNINTKLSASAQSLVDAPYSMFIIPFGNDISFYAGKTVVIDGVTVFKYEKCLIDKIAALKIASVIATTLDQKLYDIQLLPYMPDFEQYFTYTSQLLPPAVVTHYGCLLDGNYTEDTEFNYIKDSDDNCIGAILYMRNSNFSFVLPKTITTTDSAKIESECNFYRLCSPNYNGVFEFNLAKNGMSVDSFLIDCTYKPINPLIRVQPQFKGLYGTNFIDGRGLICGGDFSLPIIKDAWITYEQNNKNFASMFARDIQNLDVAQKQEALKEAISLGTGIVGGTAGGAMAGAKYGGGMGAVAGAAVGFTAGSLGAMIDAQLGQERRAEAKDYLIDRFNMNLANVKALPDTLARNSSFTIINKIYPFVEYYSSTDEEKQALERKIRYDGMTVGRVDFMSNFASPNFTAENYFKGQLIRAVGIEEDTHYINALYEEIAKGVYI